MAVRFLGWIYVFLSEAKDLFQRTVVQVLRFAQEDVTLIKEYMDF